MPNIDTIYELIDSPCDNNKGEFLICKLKKHNKLSSYINYLEENKTNTIKLDSNIYEEIKTIYCNSSLIKQCNLLEFITYLNNKFYLNDVTENPEIISIVSGDIILFKTNLNDTYIGITLILDPSLFNTKNTWMTSQNLLIKDAQFVTNTFKK